ncbi:DUF4190 domain-containing protein [Actinoplanes philippinensis]|uniref:DUF4190 domain-containing protein n=1 Tax=Actinoplanes philippinensis TaxID=35752 RepID=A0A1I2B4I2_9ACTN|nr:DUF4190 domain-containing protein [Actinoplanes philippinensis]SFE51071.1 hypothetical protein SAMN05421541_102107 [Actinoplanes philippinensis]
MTETRTLAWSSLVAGLLSFLPAPGPLAGLLAIVLGFLSPTGADGRRPGQARVGILLGTISFLLFATFCVVYFGVLGYPFPRLEPYRPEPGR